VGAFVLAPGTARQSVSTNGMPGSPNYAVPLFDISGYTSGGAPGQSVYVLTGPFPNGPGFASLMQRTMSARMLGAELIGVHRLHEDRRVKVEALVGYRWLQLTEGLDFDVQTAGVFGSSNAGQIFNSHDSFQTRNSFNGAQLGMRAEAEYERFVLRASLKGALGDMYRSLSVNGSSITTAGTIFGVGRCHPGRRHLCPAEQYRHLRIPPACWRGGAGRADRLPSDGTADPLHRLQRALRKLDHTLGRCAEPVHQHDRYAACRGVTRFRRLDRTGRPDGQCRRHRRLDSGRERRLGAAILNRDRARPSAVARVARWRAGPDIRRSRLPWLEDPCEVIFERESAGELPSKFELVVHRTSAKAPALLVTQDP
jgi:hypothetical protein